MEPKAMHLQPYLTNRPFRFLSGGGGGGCLFHEKLFASCSWLKNIVYFKIMKGKIVCKAKGIFLKYIDISKF